MNDPTSYQNLNKLMRIKIKKIVENYSTKFQWRNDGTDSLMDVGFGPGDITIDILLPLLPENFERLVGIDISSKMIEYARKQHQHPKVSFEQFDIGRKLEDQELNGIKPFDHITSFYVLHYNVHNLDIAFKNMWNLLKPAGDLCILHIAQSYAFQIYKRLYQKEKWARYMYDIDNNVSPHEDVEKQVEEFIGLLKVAGFSECEIKTHNEDYIRETNEYKAFYKSVNPFIYRIPEEDQDEYMEDFCREAIALGYNLDDVNSPNCRFNNRHVDFVIYAKK
ncbi:Juvenile hormone acid O-methyltransferase [Pseudolycoriella hygida]|uniref:Juvenile hormone acid O-methyltransferase n=1 Tax=Pseudolycoriella hygida TaxID=35572 RepID=A0A9Q0MP01_9DIPT|nr:Juvenile hormone acid O-methyltransferase [Pseudolycoriella hygida]